MRIIEYLNFQTKENLAAAVMEIAEWRKTGVLVDGVLRNMAKECGDDFDVRQIEHELLMWVSVKWATTVSLKG
jgi:hypothetical protein